MVNLIFVILQVIWLDALLSIDNAAALAAIAETLPVKQQAPALRWGILGAYVGRGVMLLLAGVVINYGWLKLLAAGYLLYLVGVHFFNFPPLFNFNFKGLSTFWKTVIMIEIADLAFSLDNVAAVVAITPNIVLVIIGVFISILIMRFAAQLFIRLITWEPMLNHAAYFLILAIALELILKIFSIPIAEIVQFSISMGILAIFIIAGRIIRCRNAKVVNG